MARHATAPPPCQVDAPIRPATVCLAFLGSIRRCLSALRGWAMVFVLGRLEERPGRWKKVYLQPGGGPAAATFAGKAGALRVPELSAALRALWSMGDRAGNARGRPIYLVESALDV